MAYSTPKITIDLAEYNELIALKKLRDNDEIGLWKCHVIPGGVTKELNLVILTPSKEQILIGTVNEHSNYLEFFVRKIETKP